MPRKKKPDEHLYVDGEFDAPSVLNLVNIAHEPKLTYEESHWQSMTDLDKEIFIDELTEHSAERAESIIENYPNQAKEYYLARMSDETDDSDYQDETGYTEQPEGDDDRAESDEYNFYGDKEADEHGTTVNPEVAIAYTNDWMGATRGWGDRDDDDGEIDESAEDNGGDEDNFTDDDSYQTELDQFDSEGMTDVDEDYDTHQDTDSHDISYDAENDFLDGLEIQIDQGLDMEGFDYDYDYDLGSDWE